MRSVILLLSVALLIVPGCGPWGALNPPEARVAFGFLVDRRATGRPFATGDLIAALGQPDLRVSMPELERFLAGEYKGIRGQVTPAERVAEAMRTVCRSFLAAGGSPSGRAMSGTLDWRRVPELAGEPPPPGKGLDAQSRPAGAQSRPGQEAAQVWLYLWWKPYKTRMIVGQDLFGDVYGIEEHSFFFVVRGQTDGPLGRVMGCDVLPRAPR